MARNKKSRSTRDFLKKHPNCCFCGGKHRATTRDHVPSRQMFALRRRPKGLEFPACSKCNNLTGSHEQVAALIARCYPDPPKREELREYGRLFRAVKKQSPMLFAELLPSWRQQYDFQKKFGQDASGGILNVSGPLVNRSMEMFGIKLTLALHYECTGRIVPPLGQVSVRFYTNWNRLNDTIPSHLLALEGNPKSLRQGNWSVKDQFEFQHTTDEDGKFGIYVAAFRKSFLIAGFAHTEKCGLSKLVPEATTYCPGSWLSA